MSMKKIILLNLLLFLSIFLFDFYPHKAYAEKVVYAKIQSENCFMFSSLNNSDKSKLFTLPKSYFVKLINDANEDYYYCSYKDIEGFVKKSEVVAMKGTPAKPYIEGRFRTFSLEGLGLYSSPQLLEDNLLTNIPYLTDDLIYYGTMTGQEVIPEKSDKWIYCKYNAERGICGYVYSVFCDKVPIYTENTEQFDVIESPFSQNTTPKELSPVAMGFIIVGVAIPCLIVLFLLVKPTIMKEKLNTEKPKLRAKRNRDYFEFDDSDLN